MINTSKDLAKFAGCTKKELAQKIYEQEFTYNYHGFCPKGFIVKEPSYTFVYNHLDDYIPSLESQEGMTADDFIIAMATEMANDTTFTGKQKHYRENVSVCVSNI